MLGRFYIVKSKRLNFRKDSISKLLEISLYAVFKINRDYQQLHLVWGISTSNYIVICSLIKKLLRKNETIN